MLHFDCAKAPGLNRSKMTPYYNIGSFSIVQSRELSRGPNVAFIYAQLLNTDEYTYVFVDLRGYGGSKAMQGAFSIEEASSDAIKLINSLAWDEFHLIGHSMSGMIVQKIAVNNPSRVKSLVAITPVPACGTPGPKEIMDFFAGMAVDNDEAAMEFVNRLTDNRTKQLLLNFD